MVSFCGCSTHYLFKPKYIFHVPVDIIFPEIREAYIAKIKNPMDLTTAEAKLLQGVYQNADEVSISALIVIHC